MENAMFPALVMLSVFVFSSFAGLGHTAPVNPSADVSTVVSNIPIENHRYLQ
jgi:hypothetical protein